MSLFGQMRRYIVPTLRLARFLAVWGSITITLWILAFPVIAREVFKGLLRRNAARNSQTPWTQFSSQNNANAQSQSNSTHSSSSQHQQRSQRSSSTSSSRRYSTTDPRFASRQSSTETATGYWSRSSSNDSTSGRQHYRHQQNRFRGVYADESTSSYYEHSSQHRTGRLTPPPKYTRGPALPSPPRSTSPPQPHAANPVSSSGWQV
jgi:hypothetical protein